MALVHTLLSYPHALNNPILLSSQPAHTTQALPVVGSIGNPQRPTLIRDLVKLLYESEDPLWELVRFEAETSAAQDEKVRGGVAGLVCDGDCVVERSSVRHACPQCIVKVA